MKKNKTGIITAIIGIVICTASFLFGLTSDARFDPMGYSLIILYGVMPLTALITSAIMAATGFKGTIPCTLINVVIITATPFILYKNGDWIVVFFGLIPALIGIGIGYLIKHKKQK